MENGQHPIFHHSVVVVQCGTFTQGLERQEETHTHIHTHPISVKRTGQETLVYAQWMQKKCIHKKFSQWASHGVELEKLEIRKGVFNLAICTILRYWKFLFFWQQVYLNYFKRIQT